MRDNLNRILCFYQNLNIFIYTIFYLSSINTGVEIRLEKRFMMIQLDDFYLPFRYFVKTKILMTICRRLTKIKVIIICLEI